MKQAAFLFIFFSLYHVVNGQVGIGTTSPSSSAVLDLQSTNRGFLPPRLTTIQRNNISSPRAGLVVFDTDANLLYLYDGTAWRPLCVGSGSSGIAGQVNQSSSDFKTNGYFGIDVAISDNYAVVGAMNADSPSVAGTGVVYVYKKATFGGWTLDAKLYPSDYGGGSGFGASVATAGNYVVVGAPISDVPSGITSVDNAGEVYVFLKQGNNWIEQTHFVRPGTPKPNDNFGFSVAISTTTSAGATLLVGAPYVDSLKTNGGAAFVYNFNGTAWNHVQTLFSSDRNTNDNLGYDLAIDGDYCVVSSPYRGNGTCYAFVYGGGVWTEQQKLLTYSGQTGGYSVSIKGDMIAFGAPTYPYSGSGSMLTGGVYIYRRDAGTTWTNTQVLYLKNSQGFDFNSYFGASVSLDADFLIIGAPGGGLDHIGTLTQNDKQGYAFIYKKNSDGSFYFYKELNDGEPFVPIDFPTFFGNAVSAKNGYYIIGAPGKTQQGKAGAGAVVFGYLE